MAEPKSHIGSALAQRRERLGLTQAQLARRMGRTQTYIARVEGGKRDPRWSTVLDFARALELEPMLVSREQIGIVEALVEAQSGPS